MADLHTQLTDEEWFLEAVELRADLPDYLPPRRATMVTLCTLAERLTAGQVQRIYDALPRDLRPLFAACVPDFGRPATKFDDAGFLDLLAHRLAVSPAHGELIAESVFQVLREVLPAEVIEHVAVQLPRDLVDLWLGTRAPLLGAEVPADTAKWELLTDISDGVPLPVGVDSARALSSVMCAFSQRLSGGEARDVLLGLPRSVRPLVDDCFLRHGEHAEVFDRDDLVARVAEDLRTSLAEADYIIRVVLTAVKRMLPMKEQDDIASQLPRDLFALWDAA